MKEIVILSGKGGTGKTTILASFAALAENSVIADCDVDAPNLHILLSPEVSEKGDFSASQKAVIIGDQCINCEECIEYCRFNAITNVGTELMAKVTIDPLSCEGCGICVRICPHSAIYMKEHKSGTWYLSETRFGPMVHALLDPGEENSGKLVALVKQKSKMIAKDEEIDLILVDGPPGIGCPVISSLSGANIVVLVAEPSKSCISDFKRIVDLTRTFHVKPVVIINKCDLSPLISSELETEIAQMGIDIVGQIPFDESVVKSMSKGKSVVENGKSMAAEAIMSAWNELLRYISL